MPSTEPTAGSATVNVGSEAVSVPAWNADCCHTVAAMPTSTHAYSSGVRSSAHIPSPSRSTTPLVSTENTPHSEPETTPNSTARIGPDQMRAPSRHSSSAGPITATTTIQVPSGALECPACGSPTVTNTATPAANSTAQVHSERVTLRWPSLALIGSANSKEVTNSAWTSTTDPRPSAAACSAKPTAATRLPSHHRGLRSSRENNAIAPTRSSVTSWDKRC